MDNYQQVLLQMEQFGIELREGKDLPLKMDTPKRKTCGKGGKDWYKLHIFRPDAGGSYVVGTFGTYRHGGDWRKVEIDWAPLTEAERARHEAERAAARLEAAAKRKVEIDFARADALQQWHMGARAGKCAYLERKLVQPEACRFMRDGSILVPMLRYDLPVEERLRGLQRIYSEERTHWRTGELLPMKVFTKDFDMPGCSLRLGEVGEGTKVLLVCEGYATGLTLRLALEKAVPVFLAFTAGNLEHVIPILRGLYPSINMLICADDDWRTRDRHTGELTNPGRTAAKKIAKQTARADYIYPIFAAATRQPGDTDFNDLHMRQGLDAVRQQVAGVVSEIARLHD